MEIKKQKFRGGLVSLPTDNRDFSLGAVFGVKKDLPQEFLVSGADKLKMKNQGGTDLCSAYATMTASEQQEQVELNPQFQFAFSKKISGNIESWGQDLRSACATPKKFGSLEQQMILNSIGLPENPRDWNDWGKRVIEIAQPHKKKSYFRADLGFGNKFDLIKSAIYQHNSIVVSGLEWKSEYTYCKNAIIKPSKESGFGHAIALIGWKIIDGKEYLIIHNSIGEDLGDNGLWYLPREMVDELRYGNFVFKDMPADKVKLLLEQMKLKKISLMKKTLDLILQQVLLIAQELKRKTKPNVGLYNCAKSQIGKDIAPTYNILACMEAVNTVIEEFTGKPIGGGASTYLGYLALKKDKRFIQVRTPMKGDLIISPSGFGQGHGHIGIVSEDKKIMSNNSKTGLWDEHFNLSRWEWKYKIVGKFPIYYYRLITK